MKTKSSSNASRLFIDIIWCQDVEIDDRTSDRKTYNATSRKNTMCPGVEIGSIARGARGYHASGATHKGVSNDPQNKKLLKILYGFRMGSGTLKRYCASGSS